MPHERPQPTTGPLALGETAVRWSSTATTIPQIQRELARLWSARDLTTEVDGVRSRHIAARTSVMNLVVIATTPEEAEQASSTIAALTGRHPSRTLVVLAADPDGPVSLRSTIEAHCVLPRPDAPEVCAEMVHITAGGAAGRHLDAVVAPLLVHDLPVTVWWPGEPAFGTEPVATLLEMTDRLVVDGSQWQGDGLDRLRAMALLQARSGLAISDFALVRQSRWREAIASVFDMPDLLPFLRSVRRIAVTYASTDPTEPAGATNVVKPVYHVAWLASRLGLIVERPLAVQSVHRGRPGHGAWVYDASLRGSQGEVKVSIGPAASDLAPGTTLQVELLAERRGSELRATITADAGAITVRGALDGLGVVDRAFLAPRRMDGDLLEEAIELGVRDRIAGDTVRFAAGLVSARTEAVA